jgi:hypothetical protein
MSEQIIERSILRLSALRALLYRIYPGMRLVKIKAAGRNIVLTVVMDREPGEQIRDEISIAGAEIIADFPEAAQIQERFEIVRGEIAAEDIFAEGWVFRRAEDAVW